MEKVSETKGLELNSVHHGEVQMTERPLPFSITNILHQVQ